MRQRAAERELDAVANHEGPEGVSDPIGPMLMGAARIKTCQGLKGWIGIFDDQPAARTKRGSQLAEDGFTLRQVNQHKARVDEIKRPGRDRVRHHIVL